MPHPQAAVLGHPIAHSLSPVLHRAAYAALGLDWAYHAIDCPEGDLGAFLDSLDDTWVGVSLTMPLKRAIVPMLDEVSEAVSTVGAANTVLFRDGVRVGANTDIAGIAAALDEAGAADPRGATVLGAGGTAAAALAALAGRGSAGVSVVVRSLERARPLAAVAARLGIGIDVVPWPGAAEHWSRRVVVSTVPAGASDALAAALPGLPSAFVDVVYEPWPTALAASIAAAGGQVAGGLSVLVAQAAAQVELMTEQPAPLAAMQTAGRAALAARNPA